VLFWLVVIIAGSIAFVAVMLFVIFTAFVR
jgi:hypothetical protein